MAALLPYLLVGVGGFLGANARFLVARGVGALFETRFPLGTFVINVSGSFLLGVLGTVIADKVFPASEAMRLALGVGFLGAFTTFSTFEFETHALLNDGSWLTATANMAASLLVGLIAVRAGMVVARDLADLASNAAHIEAEQVRCRFQLSKVRPGALRGPGTSPLERTRLRLRLDRRNVSTAGSRRQLGQVVGRLLSPS